MGGLDKPIEGGSIGGRPFEDPLQLTHVGARVAKEAREDVEKRPKLATQVFQADDYLKGDLNPAG